MNNTPHESSERCSLKCQLFCNTRLVALLYKTPIPLIYYISHNLSDGPDRSMQRPDEATDDNAKDSRALKAEYDTLEASSECAESLRHARRY